VAVNIWFTNVDSIMSNFGVFLFAWCIYKESEMKRDRLR
jgi:hypothetical protein